MSLSFADVYDALMEDSEATGAWADFVKSRVKQGTILECACGSGHLAYRLAQSGYQVTGMDLDPAMIQRARNLFTHPKLDFMEGDMLELKDFGCYDAILCFGDSLNYLEDLNQVDRFFEEAFAHLRAQGLLLFDMHTLNRLEEFREEYVEEGFIGDLGYQWSIATLEPDRLDHHFVLYEADGNRLFRFTQTVFEESAVSALLSRYSPSIELVYDFTHTQLNDAEKAFFAVRKGTL